MVEPIKELKLSCQRNETEFLPLRVLRKISIYFTWLLLHTPITANGVTILLLMSGILGAVFLAIGRYWYAIGGVLLLQLHLILDCVDGEVARYRQTSSWFGIYFDNTAHGIILGLMFAGIGWGVYYQYNPSNVVLALSFSAALFSVLCLHNPMIELWARVKHLGSGSDVTHPEMRKILAKVDQQKRVTNRSLIAIYLLIFDLIPMMFVTFPTAAIFNHLDFVLYFYGLAYPLLFALTSLLTFIHWGRSLG